MKREAWFCDGNGKLEAPGRRAVVLAAAGAAVGWLGARSAWAQAAFGESKGDPPLLVVVFLRGGADGLNVVVPYADEDYYRFRPSLGIARPGDRRVGVGQPALDLDGFFGLNPALAPLLPEYKEGRMAVVQAVGSRDTTRSHFEAMSAMERGARDSSSGDQGGWLARYLNATEDGSAPLRAVSFSSVAPESLGGATHALTVESLDRYSLDAGSEVGGLLERMYAQGDDLMTRAGRETLSLLKALAKADPQGARPEGGASYPDSPLGRAFRQVAFVARQGLGLEVACLESMGWDSHVAQGRTEGWLTELLADLGGSVAAFLTDMGREAARTTVVVMSEFGRRIEENAGFGTDHGSGGAMLVLGAGVTGGRVYGRWPGLAASFKREPGDLLVTTDYRDVLSEVVASRLRPVETGRVFPGHLAAPVGLMAGRS